MMSLANFITQHRGTRRPANEYVKADGFESLYVRLGPRYLPDDAIHHPTMDVFDIANATAKRPGDGAFTKLMASLLETGFVVYVECVHNKRLQAKLERDGFTRADTHVVPSYFKKPEKP